MAQKTFVAGDVLTAADVNTFLTGEGGAWSSWATTVTQGSTVGHTINYARFARYGRTILAQCRLTMTGTGTSSSQLSLSVPVNHVHGTAGPPIGTISLSDVSANEIFVGYAYPLSSSSVFFLDLSVTAAQRGSGAGTMGSGGSTFNAAIASGDILTVSLCYEATS